MDAFFSGTYEKEIEGVSDAEIDASEYDTEEDDPDFVEIDSDEEMERLIMNPRDERERERAERQIVDLTGSTPRPANLPVGSGDHRHSARRALEQARATAVGDGGRANGNLSHMMRGEAANRGEGDQDEFILPDGIDLEEAKQLEAAMFGVAYEAPEARRPIDPSQSLPFVDMNASDGERIRPGAAREGNATTVTDSSTEGITTAEIQERQRRIDAWDKTVKQLKEEDCDEFNEWLRDSTTEVLVEYEGDKRIRTFFLCPKVIAVRFLDLKLKHGVGDSVKEDRATIRKCLEASRTQAGTDDFCASKRIPLRILRQEMLALCDCDVDKISSFHDFETLFENVKTQVGAVLPAVLKVIEEKNKEVRAVLNRRDAVKAFVIEVVEKETVESGAFCKFLKREYSKDAWAHVIKRSGWDKRRCLCAFLEDECEILETIPDGDGVTKWVADMVELLEEQLKVARAALNRPSRRSKRGASTLAKEPSIDEDQPSHQKAARTERVTDVIKQACEADAELKEALDNARSYADLVKVLLSVRTQELSKEGISSFIEACDRACLCWAAIEVSIDPQCMQDFEEQRYAIARPFGATAYMPCMLAAMLSNVRVVRAKELLEGGAYADYERMCSIDPRKWYKVLKPFSVTLAGGKTVFVEGSVLRPHDGRVEEHLQRTLDSLKEIGCTIKPDVALKVCYESALTELMRQRGYHEYLKGIHAKPENCVKTTIVENVIGVERTGGGIVTVAFTFDNINVIFRTDMIYMLKRVEMILDGRDGGGGLTHGELIKLTETRSGEDGEMVKIAEKLLLWAQQLPWIHLGIGGRLGHAVWRRDLFAAHDDPDAYSSSPLGEDGSALRHILWPRHFTDAPFEISEELKIAVTKAVKSLRRIAIIDAVNGMAFTLFLEFSQIVPGIRAREWWSLDLFKYEVLDACGALSEFDDYKQNNPMSAWQRSSWKIDVIINTIMEKAENFRELFEDLQLIPLDALTKDGHVDFVSKRPRGNKVRRALTSDDFDLITPKFECYAIFFNTLVQIQSTKQIVWFNGKMTKWRSVVESSPEAKRMIDQRKEEFSQFLLPRLTPPEDARFKINYPSIRA